MISAQQIQYSYGRSLILDGVDIRVPDRGFLGLIGPNGSGKTTLLRTLYRSLNPQSGHVQVGQRPLNELSPAQRAREIAVVVQENRPDVDLKVAEFVALARCPEPGWAQRLANTLSPGLPAADVAAIDAALKVCGITELAAVPVSQLSGGQRQRAYIARGLAQSATHLLLDEPTNHLDLRYQHEVLGLLKGLSAGVIAVLHDLNLAHDYCDEVVLLQEGKVVASGSPHQVMVPELLEPIYGVSVNKIRLGARWHLVLGPGNPEQPTVEDLSNED